MIFPIAALAGGSVIFIVVIIALFFAVIFGFYTYRGSAINPHPSDGLDGAPGSDEPSSAAGKGRKRGSRQREAKYPWRERSTTGRLPQTPG